VDTVGLEIDARYNGLDVWKVAPELGEDNSRIDLIKLFDRDKGVKNANTRQIESRKKVVGDPRNLPSVAPPPKASSVLQDTAGEVQPCSLNRHLSRASYEDELLSQVVFVLGVWTDAFELLSALQITFRFFRQQL
jgi:hypothetical protein